MIQRIQTVYLAIAVILLSMVFAFNFATYQVGEVQYVFSVNGLSPSLDKVSVLFPYKIILPIIIAGLVFTILQYKKRKLQLKIIRMIYLVILIVLAFLFYDMSALESGLDIKPENASYGAGLFLIAASWPLVFLANRAIKKDEELVKSVERLR